MTAPLGWHSICSIYTLSYAERTHNCRAGNLKAAGRARRAERRNSLLDPGHVSVAAVRGVRPLIHRWGAYAWGAPTRCTRSANESAWMGSDPHRRARRGERWGFTSSSQDQRPEKAGPLNYADTPHRHQLHRADCRAFRHPPEFPCAVEPADTLPSGKGRFGYETGAVPVQSRQ